jgi:DnaJ-class molecular chaperone
MTFTWKGDDAMSEGDRKNPGDEDTPGTKQTGENVCPTCHGSGLVNQRPCPDCDGGGRVTVIVGDA